MCLLADTARRLKLGAPLLLSDLLEAKADGLSERETLIACAVGLGMPPARQELMRTHLQTEFFPLRQAQLADLAAASGFHPPRLFFRTLSFGGWCLRRR